MSNGLFERINVVDAFTDEGALVKSILIHVRNGASVRIDPRLTTEKTRVM